jgi:hypothetical protein
VDHLGYLLGPQMVSGPVVEKNRGSCVPVNSLMKFKMILPINRAIAKFDLKERLFFMHGNALRIFSRHFKQYIFDN